MIIKIIFLILVTIILVGIFFAIYQLYHKMSINKRISDINIKPRNKNGTTKKNTWFNYFFSKLDTEKIEEQLMFAGYPLGMDNLPTYVICKSLFTIGGIILGIEFYSSSNITRSMLILLGTSMFGFYVTDIIIKNGKKYRSTSINNQLPNFLVFLDTYNKSGLVFEEILNNVVDILKGDFKKEVIRFNVEYSMTKNFEICLKNFIYRLGIEDSDSLEIKIRQCVLSGIYDDVLSNETDLIDRKILNEQLENTKKFELYLALAMGLLLLNMFLIFIYPLSSMVTSSMSNLF